MQKLSAALLQNLSEILAVDLPELTRLFIASTVYC